LNVGEQGEAAARHVGPGGIGAGGQRPVVEDQRVAAAVFLAHGQVVDRGAVHRLGGTARDQLAAVRIGKGEGARRVGGVVVPLDSIFSPAEVADRALSVALEEHTWPLPPLRWTPAPECQYPL